MQHVCSDGTHVIQHHSSTIAYLGNQQLGRVVADAAQHLDNGFDKANVEHWFCQLNVPKVARAVLGACTVGRALGAAVKHAQAGVGWAAELWASLVIADGLVDVGDRIASLCGCDAAMLAQCCMHVQ